MVFQLSSRTDFPAKCSSMWLRMLLAIYYPLLQCLDSKRLAPNISKLLIFSARFTDWEIPMRNNCDDLTFSGIAWYLASVVGRLHHFRSRQWGIRFILLCFQNLVSQRSKVYFDSDSGILEAYCGGIIRITISKFLRCDSPNHSKKNWWNFLSSHRQE